MEVPGVLFYFQYLLHLTASHLFTASLIGTKTGHILIQRSISVLKQEYSTSQMCGESSDETLLRKMPRPPARSSRSERPCRLESSERSRRPLQGVM